MFIVWIRCLRAVTRSPGIVAWAGRAKPSASLSVLVAHRAGRRLTCGNPFYVTEVVQAGLGVVPSSARDAVLARAARLSGGSREVLTSRR